MKVAAAENVIRIPVRPADCFLLAMDAFMRRHGQGAHNCLSILELAECPDLEKLQIAVEKFSRKHPLLCARLRRSWRTWQAYWESPPDSLRPSLSLGISSESGSSGILAACGAVALNIEDAPSFLQDQLSRPMDCAGDPFNARIDLVERRDGSFLLAFTWSHRIMDGKGAELLLADLGRLCAGIDDPKYPEQPPLPETSYLENIQRTKPLIIRFDKLAELGVHSLGGPKPRPGVCRFQVVTLSESESVAVRARAAKITGALFPLPYYLACATRAHAAIFAKRGKMSRCHVSAVPIQTRRRGARGPLFHNQVSIFFFCCLDNETTSLTACAASLKRQFVEMTREKINESFDAILELMMRVPAYLFMAIVRWQFRGEINTFFFSHTGVFAPELVEFAGAKIENAWHLPNVGLPPGTGIFFNERNEKLTFTLSWRENSLTEEERDMMIGLLRDDLLGTPQPTLARAM